MNGMPRGIRSSRSSRADASCAAAIGALARFDAPLGAPFESRDPDAALTLMVRGRGARGHVACQARESTSPTSSTAHPNALDVRLAAGWGRKVRRLGQVLDLRDVAP